MSGPLPSIAKHVLAFCGSINPGTMPVYMNIRPEPGCDPRECFPNVQRKVEREGGRIQYGWEITQWPGVFIEAVHHGVYEAPAGPPWLDITPPGPEEEGLNRRLFLPDNSAVYDFSNPDVRRDNIHHPLVSDPLVDEYLAIAAELVAITNSVPGTGMVTIEGPTAERVQSLVQRSSRMKREIAMKYTPYGAPCFCGSGQKFKRCHGQPRQVKP